jgi:hypothetical protein
MRSEQIVRRSTVLALVVISVAWAQAQQPKPQTATQFYMDYRAAFDKATKVDDLFPYMSAGNRKEIEGTPKADREKMFGMMKIVGTLTSVKVTKETPTPDGGALLAVEAVNGDKQKTTGSITIIKENGAWKIGKENWSS